MIASVRDKSIVIVALASTAALLLVMAQPVRARPGRDVKVSRFAANFLLFDGTEINATSSDDADSPINFYSNTLRIPARINVLYISVDGTGDTDDVALLGCDVDGVPCNPGSGFADEETGFITVQNTDESGLEDNNINAVWCTPISPDASGPSGTVHEVNLYLASGGSGDAWMEQIHVFIDGNRIKNPNNACSEMIPPEGT